MQLLGFILLVLIDKAKPTPKLNVSLRPKIRSKPRRRTNKLGIFLILAVFLSVFGVLVLGVKFVVKKTKNRSKKQIEQEPAE